VADIGVERMQSVRWQQLARLPEKAFEGQIARAKESDQEITTAGMLKLARQVEARKPVKPQGTAKGPHAGFVDSLKGLVAEGHKFATIYADPPWPYANQATRSSTDNHYQTMSIEDICREPVGQLAEDNAHLHLWTTNAFLPDAFRVIEAWGFEYKSCFVWVKPQMGIG